MSKRIWTMMFMLAMAVPAAAQDRCGDADGNGSVSVTDGVQALRAAASLPSSFVWDVVEDGSGRLWVATAGGLARWDRKTDRFTRQEALPGEHIRVLAYAPGQNALQITPRGSSSGRMHSIIEVTAALPDE